MSHVSQIEIEIIDLNILKKSCQRLGLTFLENQKSYTWYGRLVNPEKYPLPEGVQQNELGHCDHAIKVPNAQYEVGVLNRNGHWLLLADFWDSRLRTGLGENGNKLKQAYAVEKTIVEAKKRQYRIVEQKTEQGIRLTLSK